MKFISLVTTLISAPVLRVCLLVAITVLSSLQVSALPSLERLPNLRPTLPDERAVRHEGIDTDRAVAIAERRYNGRAVGARHLGNGLYRVRILQNDGKVKTVTVRPD